MGKGGRAAIWVGAVGGIIALGALALLWRWVLDQPEDIRVSYMQTAAVIFPGAAAVAAFGSLGAALAARSAAKASAATARQAQEALARHFKPGGGWRTWTKHDDLAHAPEGLTAADLGDRVMAQFQYLIHVGNLQFWYTTESGEHGPVSVPPAGGLVELHGVVGVPRSADGVTYNWRAQTNVTRWRARCYEPNASATWEVVHVPNPLAFAGDGTGGSLDFELVRTG